MVLKTVTYDSDYAPFYLELKSNYDYYVLNDYTDEYSPKTKFSGPSMMLVPESDCSSEVSSSSVR